MHKALKPLAGAILAAALCSCAGETASSREFLFDSYYSVSLSGGAAENVLDELDGLLTDMSGAFELCYGTDAADLPDDPLYADCLDRTAALGKRYGGGIDPFCGALTGLWGISSGEPRVPSDAEISEALGKISADADGMRYDFGAVAKGYACDRALELLAGTETEYAVVSLSSSTLLYGEKPDGEPFRVGITDPFEGEGYLGVISTGAAFVSTSGGYERCFEADGKQYCHILDIRTGRPVETDLVSVTVIVPIDTPDGGIMSDYLATLIFMDGSEKLDKWLADTDIQVVAADGNGLVRSSCAGFVPE